MEDKIPAEMNPEQAARLKQAMEKDEELATYRKWREFYQKNVNDYDRLINFRIVELKTEIEKERSNGGKK